MSTVSGVGSIFSGQATTTNTTDTSSTSSTSTQVTQSEFLKLLVAQLQNQDPTNPISNEEFVTQLAQFSSLDQLISINSAVSKLAGVSK